MSVCVCVLVVGIVGFRALKSEHFEGPPVLPFAPIHNDTHVDEASQHADLHFSKSGSFARCRSSAYAVKHRGYGPGFGVAALQRHGV